MDKRAIRDLATVAGVPQRVQFSGWGRGRVASRLTSRHGSAVVFTETGRGVFQVEVMEFEIGSASLVFLGALALGRDGICGVILSADTRQEGPRLVYRLAAAACRDQLRFAFSHLREELPHRWEVNRAWGTDWQSAVLRFSGWEFVVGIGCREEAAIEMEVSA